MWSGYEHDVSRSSLNPGPKIPRPSRKPHDMFLAKVVHAYVEGDAIMPHNHGMTMS